jgi:hypothetical protein
MVHVLILQVTLFRLDQFHTWTYITTVQSVPITPKLWLLFFRSWQGILDTTVHVKVYQWFVPSHWFSYMQGTPSSINKTDRHTITDIMLKVALNNCNSTHQWLFTLLWLYCMHNFGSNEQFFSPTMERTSVCAVCYNFHIKTMFDSSLTPICFVGGSCFIYVICIYILVSNRISISYDVHVV